MKAMKPLLIVLSLFVVLPTWYYLMYVMLSAAHVDRHVWFLFYVYMVVNFVSKCLVIAYDAEKDQDKNKEKSSVKQS